MNDSSPPEGFPSQDSADEAHAAPLEETPEQFVPDASMLEDRFPEWARLSRSTVVWVILLGIIYLFLSYQRLWHTDIWGHLAYGRVIVESGNIPETEPLMPLSEGVRFIDTAWLSQLISYEMAKAWGPAAMRFVFAATLLTCLIALLVRFRQKTDSYGLCLIGWAVFGLVAWKALAIVRPQLAGLACYTLVWTLLLSRKWNGLQWIGIPLLFLFWANLHGSFLIGLAVILMMGFGTTADQYLRTKRLCAPQSLKYFLLAQLSAVATLVNPYGLSLYPAIREISSNPNMQQVGEWSPLVITTPHGQGLAATAILLIILYRLTPRRVSIAEPLLLFSLALGGMISIRLLIWWTPIAAWFTVLHFNAVLQQWKALQNPEDEETPAPQTAGLYTVVVVGMSWIFFSYTPFGSALLHGNPEDPQRAEAIERSHLGRLTPYLLTKYLSEHEPEGLIFNPYEWGDYLIWTGPGRQIFLNSHAHLVPEEVWNDYFIIARGVPGWDDKLDRYGINTALVDKVFHTRLIDNLRQSDAWQLDYEDEVGVIFRRSQPIGIVPKAAAKKAKTEAH